MLGLVVLGSRTWICTIAAPALASSRQELAICSGVTGTAGFLPGVSAEPVTAQEIITFRAMPSSLGSRLVGRSAQTKGARPSGARQAPRGHGCLSGGGVLLVERDADDSAEIALADALLVIAGDVDLPLRRAVATQAGRAVVFRHRGPMGGLAP